MSDEEVSSHSDNKLGLSGPQIVGSALAPLPLPWSCRRSVRWAPSSALRRAVSYSRSLMRHTPDTSELAKIGSESHRRPHATGCSRYDLDHRGTSQKNCLAVTVGASRKRSPRTPPQSTTRPSAPMIMRHGLMKTARTMMLPVNDHAGKRLCVSCRGSGLPWCLRPYSWS